MQSIEYKKEDHPILNQIYDILAEHLVHDKKITLCKITAHIGIEWNEEADKEAKQAIDVPGMTTMRLSYTDYYLTIWRIRNSEW